MLDTAGKDGLSLRNHLGDEELRDFVSAARRLRLAVGLAGSLREGDIPHLLPFHPDYLGFRGALCGGNTRTANIDGEQSCAFAPRFRCNRYGEGELALRS
jgi:dihydroneopterin aldolase